jgi:transposase
MARPTKLTSLVQDRLCNAIRAGNYYETACAYAGISYSTFREWMIRGEARRSGSPFLEFLEAVRAAEAEAEMAVVALWQRHIPDNWQAARDFLARRYPERWAPRDQLHVSTDIDALLAAELARITGRRQGSITATDAANAPSDGRPGG